MSSNDDKVVEILLSAITEGKLTTKTYDAIASRLNESSTDSNVATTALTVGWLLPVEEKESIERLAELLVQLQLQDRTNLVRDAARIAARKADVGSHSDALAQLVKAV